MTLTFLTDDDPRAEVSKDVCVGVGVGVGVRVGPMEFQLYRSSRVVFPLILSELRAPCSDPVCHGRCRSERRSRTSFWSDAATANLVALRSFMQFRWNETRWIQVFFSISRKFSRELLLHCRKEEQSIVMSVSVCLSVCPSVCLYFYIALPTFLYMLSTFCKLTLNFCHLY